MYMLKNGLANVAEGLALAKTVTKDRLLAAAWGAMWGDDLLASEGRGLQRVVSLTLLDPSA